MNITKTLDTSTRRHGQRHLHKLACILLAAGLTSACTNGGEQQTSGATHAASPGEAADGDGREGGPSAGAAGAPHSDPTIPGGDLGDRLPAPEEQDRAAARNEATIDPSNISTGETTGEPATVRPGGGQVVGGHEGASTAQRDAVPSRIASYFDDSTLGWTVWGDAQGPSVDPTFVPGLGDPPGSIGADDDAAGGVWYWRAPSSYWSDEVNPTPDPRLRFDLRQSGDGPLFDACDVIVVDGGRGACLTGSAVPGATFTSYTVRFRVGDESWHEVGASGGFPSTVKPGDPISQNALDTIVGSIDGLFIRGEFITGPDSGGLDNVALGSVAG